MPLVHDQQEFADLIQKTRGRHVLLNAVFDSITPEAIRINLAWPNSSYYRACGESGGFPTNDIPFQIHSPGFLLSLTDLTFWTSNYAFAYNALGDTPLGQIPQNDPRNNDLLVNLQGCVTEFLEADPAIENPPILIRQLNDEIIDLLIPLLVNIVDDMELQVEIRNESITIYYRGAALIRDLHLYNGQLTGAIHFKYVPLPRPEQSDYLHITNGENGLGFVPVPQPLALGRLTPEVLNQYKRMMRSVSRNLEANIIHGIVSRPENRIVDQELKFQVPGLPTADKIDICHFDLGLNCLALVEVKGLHDTRLRSHDGEVPEVINQLRRYRARISYCQDGIIEACLSTISLKRQLGFAARLNGVPEAGRLSLMKKPVLIIGGCSRNDIDDILNGAPEWELLMEGLEEEAAGVILCGQNGCRLDLENGGQALIFNTDQF